MHAGHVRSADGDDQRLDLQVVAGAARAWLLGIRDHLRDRICDGLAQHLGDDALLDHHDTRGLVQLAEPIELVASLLCGGTRGRNEQRDDTHDPMMTLRAHYFLPWLWCNERLDCWKRICNRSDFATGPWDACSARELATQHQRSDGGEIEQVEAD